MKFVIIKQMSVGNDTVGKMWEETRIVDSDTSLFDIMRWAGLKKKVTITVPEGSVKEFEDKVASDPILAPDCPF